MIPIRFVNHIYIKKIENLEEPSCYKSVAEGHITLWYTQTPSQNHQTSNKVLLKSVLDFNICLKASHLALIQKNIYRPKVKDLYKEYLPTVVQRKKKFSICRP